MYVLVFPPLTIDYIPFYTTYWLTEVLVQTIVSPFVYILTGDRNLSKNLNL